MSETKATCKLIRPTEAYEGKQGHDFIAGVTAQNSGSQALSMVMLTMAPGARGKAHLHENHETALYVLSGEGAMWYGEGLKEHMDTPGGSFVYIPANVPHLPYNRSQTEPVVALIARTDPNEQESVVLLPELDALR